MGWRTHFSHMAVNYRFNTGRLISREREKRVSNTLHKKVKWKDGHNAVVNWVGDMKSSVWTAARQNKQNVMCAQRGLSSARTSAQSDQSLHCALSRYLRAQCFFMRTATALIRLGGCPGWSESSLDTQVILLVLSSGD